MSSRAKIVFLNIFLMLFVPINSFSSIVKWTPDGIGVSIGTSNKDDQLIVSDGSGGAFIYWRDSPLGCLQKINASGVGQWGANGIQANSLGSVANPTIISDGAGGAIFAWYNNPGFYVQRVSSSGSLLWGVNGVAVYGGSTQYNMLAVASDGAGGAIVAWSDARDKTYYPYGTFHVYAQRINSAGIVLWTVNGVRICSDINDTGIPGIVSDGSGGAIISWISNGIYAQRINSNGVTQWISNGVSICTASGQHFLRIIVTDGAGGAIVTWQNATGGDVYVQKVNSGGVVQWVNNGVGICTQVNAASADQSCQTSADGSGGAFFVWNDSISGTAKAYTQKINSAGTAQWTTNGVPICTAANGQQSPTLTPDGLGGVIFTWYDTRGSSNDIYAQRMNSSGVAQWTSTGLAICTAANQQTYPAICSDGVSGAIITWYDNRSGYNDIYAQRVNDALLVGSISPNNGINNATISITNLSGDNFSGTAAVKLQQSGQADINALNVSVVSATMITCSLNLSGAHIGSWDVVLTSGVTVTLAGGFTITAPPPSVNTITPSTGSNSGPTTISISGSGFFGGVGSNTVTAVKLDNGTSLTSVLVLSDSVISRAVVPSGVPAGTYNVQVTSNGNSNTTSAQKFVATSIAPTPTVTNLSPSTGLNSSTTTISITGSGFFGGVGINTVTAIKFDNGTTSLTGYSVGSDSVITGAIVPSGVAVGT